MSDRTFIYGLLAMSVGCLCALLMATFLHSVFGETEKECVAYRSSHLIHLWIDTYSPNGCDWLLDKLLYNGSGFNIVGFADSQYILVHK